MQSCKPENIMTQPVQQIVKRFSLAFSSSSGDMLRLDTVPIARENSMKCLKYTGSKNSDIILGNMIKAKFFNSTAERSSHNWNTCANLSKKLHLFHKNELDVKNHEGIWCSSAGFQTPFFSLELYNRASHCCLCQTRGEEIVLLLPPNMHAYCQWQYHQWDRSRAALTIYLHL